MASPFIRPYQPPFLPREILRQDSETQPYQNRPCFGGSLAAPWQCSVLICPETGCWSLLRGQRRSIAQRGCCYGRIGTQGHICPDALITAGSETTVILSAAPSSGALLGRGSCPISPLTKSAAVLSAAKYWAIWLPTSAICCACRGAAAFCQRAAMSDLPLFQVPPQAPRSRQGRTSSGRRAKIARQVERAKIVRIRIRRTDNDGRVFRTSFSLDRTVFDVAALIWGGEDTARLRLVQLAEATWAADNRARQHADAEGRSYSAAVSVSRFVQAAVIADAAVRLRQFRDQGLLPLAVPARRGSTKPVSRQTQTETTPETPSP